MSLGNTSPTTRSSLERFAADAFETAFRSPAVAPISLNNNSFGLVTGGGAPGQGLVPLSKSPTPGDLGAKDQKNVEIAEVIVGAILGNIFIYIIVSEYSGFVADYIKIEKCFRSRWS